MIETDALTKRYGSILAVDRVDLAVPEGARYGLLGLTAPARRRWYGCCSPSSTRPVAASRCWAGRYPNGPATCCRHRRAGRGPAGYPHLSGRAHLRLFDAAGPGGSRRTRAARVQEALTRVGLSGVDRRPLRAYSLGMRQRYGLAAALLRGPRLLILDEPTRAGSAGIREIRDLLLELNQAVPPCSSPATCSPRSTSCVPGRGDGSRRLVLQEDLAVLRAPTAGSCCTVRTPARWRGYWTGGSRRVRGPAGGTPRLRRTQRAAVGAGIRVAEIGPERPSLEQVVLDLTGAGSDRIDTAP